MTSHKNEPNREQPSNFICQRKCVVNNATSHQDKSFFSEVKGGLNAPNKTEDLDPLTKSWIRVCNHNRCVWNTDHYRRSRRAKPVMRCLHDNIECNYTKIWLQNLKRLLSLCVWCVCHWLSCHVRYMPSELSIPQQYVWVCFVVKMPSSCVILFGKKSRCDETHWASFRVHFRFLLAFFFVPRQVCSVMEKQLLSCAGQHTHLPQKAFCWNLSPLRRSEAQKEAFFWKMISRPNLPQNLAACFALPKWICKETKQLLAGNQMELSSCPHFS